MLTDYDKITQEETDNVKMVANYHTHNYLCKHARGTVSDYVKEAVRNGLEEIGISDHCQNPLKIAKEYVDPSSNFITEYLPQFDEAQKLYGGRIKIYKAVEIEYFEGHDEYYKDLLKKVDYLVLGQHYFQCGDHVGYSFNDGKDEQTVLTFFDSLITAVKTKMFKIVAHPDFIFFQDFPPTPKIKEKFDEFMTVAKECGVLFELNANGIRSNGFKYPTDLFISLLKKHNAKVIISSDAHAPEFLCDDVVKHLYAYAIKKGLNVVWKIDGLSSNG